MLESPGINCTVRPETPTRMREASTLATLGAVLCFCASSAHAVGFGRVSNTTQLGQPLNFSAVIRLEPDESLTRECVSAEVQSGENMLQPGLVRATLEGSADAADRVVRVTTSVLIDEPVVTVSVTVGCDARVTRKFVAFVDPPVLNLAQAQPQLPISNDASTTARSESPVAPVFDAARSMARPVPEQAARTYTAKKRARTRVAATARPVAAPAPEARAPQAAEANRSNAVARAAPVARAASGPRLVVESAPRAAAVSASAPASGPMAAVAPTNSASAAMTPPPPALPLDDQATELARERERVRLLEDGLAKLRSDSQATQKSLVALQAKLKQAEALGDSRGLAYALGALAALLAMVAAALAWRQWRSRKMAEWWNPPTSGATLAAPDEAAPVAANRAVPPARALAANLQATKLPAARSGHFPTITQEASLTAPAPLGSGAGAVVEEPVRELSVEELIDLEQQAEFFLVLGQDDAAIELLMSHVRSDGGVSPLPYLKLLEIYRRQGDTAAYQRIRERFNLRFNAYAPDWDADLQHGRTLVDYPDTLKRLQDLWSAPPRVMETLDASLLRRNSADETFDLPAYRELLFLYSVARDLAEHNSQFGAADFVDLLLPMNEHDAVSARASVAHLSASSRSADFVHSDLMTLPVDLDVSFEPTYPAPAPAPVLAKLAPAGIEAPRNAAGDPEYGFLEFDIDAIPQAPRLGSTGKA